MDEPLGQFAEGCASWRRMLAAVSEDNTAVRWQIFSNAAHEIAVYVAHGLDRVAAVDELQEIAEAHGLALIDADTVGQIIADAFADVPEDQVANGKDYQPILPIPVTFPFPIKGDELPRRPWLVPGLLLRRQVTLMVAPPGIGKSLLTLQLGILCASGGQEWNRWQPRGRYRVLVINVEEDHDEMRRRLCAAATVMKVEQSELGGLCLAQTNEIVVAKADNRTKTVVALPMLEQIVATITAHKIDIVVVDPFAETFAGDENSNSELKWAAVLWRDVARRTNAAVWLVHHTKKYAHDMAGDMDAGRGGGALAGVARIVCTLFGMSEAEATGFKIKPELRNQYIRFDDAKANLSLVSLTARWFVKETHSLGNAGDDEPADEVGVLLPWQPPDPFTNMSVEVANSILDEIEVGVRKDSGEPSGDRHSISKQSPRWAGIPIQEQLQCDEKQAKTILEKWIDNGVLEVRPQRTSTSKGKLRDCVFVNATKRPGKVIEKVSL